MTMVGRRRYYGHPHLRTVMDEVTDGLRLDRYVCGHASCSPTRGSVLTGRHPNRYGTFTPGYSLRRRSPSRICSPKRVSSGILGNGMLTGKEKSPTNPRAMGFLNMCRTIIFMRWTAFSRNGDPPVVIKGEGSEVTIDGARFIEDAKQRQQPFLAVVFRFSA